MFGISAKNFLASLLLLKAIVMIAFIQFSPIGLGPDEAQYWTWSKELDWGYYSKPPGIAWQIWLTTQLFGDTVLGVRFGAVIFAIALPCAVYLLAKTVSLSQKTALYAAVAMALCPLGVLASFLAITDTGMTVFFVLAIWSVAKALQEDTEPNYLLAGCFVTLAALFKWPAYAFWLIIFGMYPFYPKIRSHSIWSGLVVSLIGIVPSVYWNASHDWASFKHVFATVMGNQVHNGEAIVARNGNFFEFLGAQFVLVSPILFILLLLALVRLIREKQSIVIQFLAICCFSILTVCLTLSLFQKIQGNWGSYAYPAGIVLIAWYCAEKCKTGVFWLQLGLVLSVALMALTLSIPSLQGLGINIPYKLNPFRHNVGWDKLNDALTKQGYDPKKHFLFGDKYQTTSILSFYGPEQKRAHFLNLLGTRRNQFSYWPSMAAEQKDKSGYFVFFDNCPKQGQKECIEFYQISLKEYFHDVEFLGAHPLYNVNGKTVKEVFIFRGSQYNGKMPSEPNLF